MSLRGALAATKQSPEWMGRHLHLMQVQVLLRADEHRPRNDMILRSLIQQVGMGDERLIASLEIAITDRLHHLLVVLPDFL